MDEKEYGALLHKHGLKNTRARNWVLHVLLAREGVLTAEEIYQNIDQNGGKVNYSTIYRILELFETASLVEKTFLPDLKRHGYALRSIGHRHRLICLRCHKTVEISACPLASFEERIAAETTFQIVGHNLELFGYCGDCRRQLRREEEGDGVYE
ncbi:Fur family transcriptional regulator [Megasphaera vaginalis (ex Srinivasan et al. 2021)]|uniref:Ferric uptake regulator family protein n=1 Tax=Megasphaera vaginalis (ex Srinivasan et al. 2021) TaxID=1111454 RepID=U7UIL6_9FIRM|nr:Fur family transcriptional regulator [Megasphaera vaginalis (ex Srinivasan et al. 2021)]ERT59170.1 ferric uptake regulator family protein [Megasphaera vaginalis (ex Srinivasan et al. 2021)]